jgi:SAM-dependent methyltransferase
MPDYDYFGLLASTWDLHRGDTSNWSDRALFLDIVRDYGEPALDIGCGTGRILLDFLGLGIDIDGVDNSPEMLAICQAKAQKLGLSPRVYCQRMEELDLPRKYRTILAPSSAIQLVTDAGTARDTVRRIFDHLEPGGAFITPFSFEWRPGEPLDTGWQANPENTRPEDGAVVRSWAREWREPEAQLWHTEQRYEVELDGQVIETEHQVRSPEGRWYSQDQAVQLFRGAGFEDIRRLHDFTREPARDGDVIFCVLGLRP